MGRRKLVQGILGALFVLFLLVLVLKFKPQQEMPAPAPPPEGVRGVEGSLSATGFRFVEENGSSVAYDLTAKRVTEAKDGGKMLEDPVIVFPGQGKATGRKGSFDPAAKTCRIWDDARLDHAGGWQASSSAFRVTPEGEMVSEGPVQITRGALSGSAELLRYNRNSQMANLEGSVRFRQGESTMACQRVQADFATHTGHLSGPVVLTGKQGVVRAPQGTLLMGPDNRLKGIVLGTPCVGQGPKASFTARTLRADLGKDGQITAIHLEEEAEISTPGPPTSTLHTRLVDLTPHPEVGWDWRAPDPLEVDREGALVTAPSGKGTLPDKGSWTARLTGPVNGKDTRGTFSGEAAELTAEEWTLTGHARADRAGDTLTADRITRRADGSTLSEGDVHGLRKTPGAPDLTFTALRAEAGPTGYPAKLEGKAVLVRGGMTIEAPSVTVLDAQDAVAEGGATGRWKEEAGGLDTVTSQTLRYDGTRHRAQAEGEAKVTGRGYTLTGNQVTALLDAQNRPIRYEGSGNCHFEGTDYSGEGERLNYDPATRIGEAFGPNRNAVVVQKKPFRRVEGPAVLFGPKRLEVSRGASAMVRGTLEGVQPPKAAPPQPAKGKHP